MVEIWRDAPPAHNSHDFPTAACRHPIQACIRADDGVNLGILGAAAQKMLEEVAWSLTPEGEEPDAKRFENLRVKFEGRLDKSTDCAKRRRSKSTEVKIIRGYSKGLWSVWGADRLMTGGHKLR